MADDMVSHHEIIPALLHSGVVLTAYDLTEVDEIELNFIDAKGAPTYCAVPIEFQMTRPLGSWMKDFSVMFVDLSSSSPIGASFVLPGEAGTLPWRL